MYDMKKNKSQFYTEYVNGVMFVTNKYFFLNKKGDNHHNTKNDIFTNSENKFQKKKFIRYIVVSHGFCRFHLIVPKNMFWSAIGLTK